MVIIFMEYRDACMSLAAGRSCWEFGSMITVSCYTESYSKLVLLNSHDAGASKWSREPSACEMSPLSREACTLQGCRERVARIVRWTTQSRPR